MVRAPGIDDDIRSPARAMAARIRTLAARAIDAANEYCEEADAAAARPYSPIVSPPRTSPRLAARPVAFLPELCDDVVTDVLRFQIGRAHV